MTDAVQKTSASSSAPRWIMPAACKTGCTVEGVQRTSPSVVTVVQQSAGCPTIPRSRTGGEHMGSWIGVLESVSCRISTCTKKSYMWDAPDNHILRERTKVAKTTPSHFPFISQDIYCRRPWPQP